MGRKKGLIPMTNINNTLARAATTEYLAVITMAICWVGLLAYITAPMPPMWDGTWYVNMAASGVVDNEKLAAPFAYRPGMPLIARWISNIFSLPIETGFKWTGYLSATTLLVSAFALSKCFVDDFKKAIIAPIVVAISAFHIKFPIFFFTLVDVAVYPLMISFFWAFMNKRYLLSFAICLVGIFFKEFMAIPMFIQITMLARQYQLQRNSRALTYLLGTIVVCVAAILLPRVLITVYSSYQEIDPLNKAESLARLWLNPLDAKRDFNIVYMMMSYWLPTLMILTPSRIKSIWKNMGEMRLYLAIYLGLTLLLTLYGGKNIFIFVSYTVAAQIIIIAMLTREKLYTVEIIFMLIAVVLHNKIFLQIPFPTENFAAYLDFYGGYDSRVNTHSYVRFLTILILIFASSSLRYLTKRFYYKE